MPIRIRCECGKLLRAQEEWIGKKIRCPACGKVRIVPDESEGPAPAPRAVESYSPVNKTKDREEDSPEPDEPEKPRRKKKKKKKPKLDADTSSSYSRGRGIDIFGIEFTIRKVLLLAFVFTLVGGLIYVLVPAYHPKLLEARYVDVYAALDVKNRSVGKTFLGMEQRGVLYPGTEKLLIIRESPEGEHVRIRVKLPPKFLAAKANTLSGTLMMRNSDFVLKGDSASVNPLFLDLDREFPNPSEGATMDFSDASSPSPAIPQDRKPFTHAGETIKNYDAQVKEYKTDLGDKTVVTISGTGAFQGKRGMQVSYDFQGSQVIVTWDPQSKAQVGNIAQDFLDRFMLENLDMICIFPRPAGKDLYLTIYDDPVGKIYAK
jgi:hypothetical protein